MIDHVFSLILSATFVTGLALLFLGFFNVPATFLLAGSILIGSSVISMSIIVCRSRPPAK